jgi:hypothetical protein
VSRLVDALSAVAGPETVARARAAAGGAWRAAFSLAGLYQPIPDVEKELVRKEIIMFKGDVPAQISPPAHEQGRMAFRQPRPQWESVENLTMTPRGGGWASGKLHERYSAGSPGIRMLLDDRNAKRIVESGCVVQSAHHNTYGDWVSEYLCPIVRALPLSVPLFLPRQLAAQAYVRRDLARLGVEWETIGVPVHLKQAKVLRQQKYFVHFPREDAPIFRTLWPPAATTAWPGSFVYLSRRGDCSQVAQRSYPSALIEALVESRGGRVLHAATASPADYEAAAAFGETLIFDHGSAVYNTIGWPVRRVVEIVSDRWWNSAFLMLADALGIEDITIIRASLGDAHTRNRLTELLDRQTGAPLDPARRT